MQGNVFAYLERKILNEFENCDWSDDLSSRFSEKELSEMTEAMHDMITTERKVKELIEEVHGKLKYYK